MEAAVVHVEMGTDQRVDIGRAEFEFGESWITFFSFCEGGAPDGRASDAMAVSTRMRLLSALKTR